MSGTPCQRQAGGGGGGDAEHAAAKPACKHGARKDEPAGLLVELPGVASDAVHAKHCNDSVAAGNAAVNGLAGRKDDGRQQQRAMQVVGPQDVGHADKEQPAPTLVCQSRHGCGDRGQR